MAEGGRDGAAPRTLEERIADLEENTPKAILRFADELGQAVERCTKTQAVLDAANAQREREIRRLTDRMSVNDASIQDLFRLRLRDQRLRDARLVERTRALALAMARKAVRWAARRLDVDER